MSKALTTGSSLCAETKKALGLLQDTIAQLRSESMTLDELSRANAHQNPFENAARSYSKQIEMQLAYVRDRWSITMTDDEVGSLYIPRPKGYCKALLIVPADFAGPEHIFARWVRDGKFSVTKYTDDSLDVKVPNDRRRFGHYALLHSGRQEADVELKNRSWDDNALALVEMMRLTEVLLWEDCFFTQHREHIDKETMTLTGSRDSDGNVPDVYWCGDKLEVNWSCVDDRAPSLRSRAVSL